MKRYQRLQSKIMCELKFRFLLRNPKYIIGEGISLVTIRIFVLQFQGSASPVLRDVTIYSVNNDWCRERYTELPSPGIVTENMICAGILGEGGRDACQGDSGGPLYYDSNGNLIIVGVVSWGHQCANGSYPGVSTAVSPYTNWIIETVA